MKRNTPGHRTLTLKIWSVLVVFGATIACVFFWNYSNYQSLATAIGELSKPSQNLTTINNTLQEIIEAENHIQSFILTGDTLSQRIYQEKTKGIEQDLLNLQQLLSDDTIQIKRLDTLQAIFRMKTHYLASLLELKRAREANLFTGEVIKKIGQELRDTVHIDKQFLRRDILKKYTIPVEKEEIVITPDDFKGIRGFVRKIFGGDNTKIDTIRTVENESVYTYDVAVDSSIVRDYFLDSTMLVVKEILHRTMQEEIGLIKQLNQTELVLLDQNQVLISNIRSIIDDIKAREEEDAATKVATAEAISLGATRIMLLIGFAGFSLSAIFLILIIRDVARASHYRKQLEVAKGKAEQLARAREDFLSSMSHEIRTPLHNIMGFCSVLSEMPLTEKQREYIQIIGASNKYLLELVNNVLNAARVEAGKIDFRTEPLNLRLLADEVIAAFQFSAHRKGLKLQLSVDEIFNQCGVTGDALRLKEVLSNLVGNAIKFTRQGSVEVAVEGEKQGDSITAMIRVSDTGPGIAPDQVTRIFEPFTQAAAADGPNGTGLGLYITKSLVERMGGTIMARNNDTQGATLEITLTLTVAPLPTAQKNIDQPQKVYYPISVVIVEDDKWNSILLREILTSRCKTVHPFSNASDALEFIAASPNEVDLVITDVNLPGLDGMALVRKIRELGIGVPVVAVTAHGRESSPFLQDETGFDDVVLKPFGIAAIEGMLSRYFSSVESEPEHPETFVDPEPDLSDIRAFAVGDEALFIRLGNEMLTNHRNQLSNFRNYIAALDADALAELCHQMKSLYSQLKVESVAESLATIEVLARNGDHPRAIEMAKELSPQLMRMMDRLEDIMRQYHSV